MTQIAPQTATTHSISLLRADAAGVEVSVASGKPQHLSWGALREAASQSEPDLAAPYRHLLGLACDMMQARKNLDRERAAVAAARAAIDESDPWWPILAAEVPATIRWDTPSRYQGQIVERSWGTFGSPEASIDSPYMRIVDGNDRSVRYYRRRVVA